MPKQAAKEWHETYKIGELGKAYPVIYFRRAAQLIKIRDEHGLPGEAPRETILRTGRQIAERRGLNVSYNREHGGVTTLAFYKNNRP